jgi:preprotein translocase subunit SecF
MPIIKNRKIFFSISAALIVASIVAVAVWNLRLGIDFTGGSLVETRFVGEPIAAADVDARIASLDFGGYSLRATDQGYIFRTRPLDEKEQAAMVAALTGDGRLVVDHINSIGPTLGAELASKTLWSMALVFIAIVLYVAYAFRHVSKPVSSWTYGLITIVTLLHDIIIPVGVFAFLGYFAGYEVDTLFVTALLVVLGYSINDTIVIFDRVRENLQTNQEKNRKEEFDAVVGRSLSETFVRSINTSATTLIALVVLYFVGSVTTQHFALALIIGVLAGTYSSIFIAAPLLVTIARWKGSEDVA